MQECTRPSRSHGVDERAQVLANEQVGPRLYLIELAAPAIAALIEPGQFVHMLLPSFEAHILRRPFSVYRACAERGTIDIIYQTVGVGTDYLTSVKAGSECSILGPLGTPWPAQAGEGGALVVGGGVGAAPLFMLTERLVRAEQPVEVVLGAQTSSMLVTRDDYANLLGRAVHIATDDGSEGFAGFATEPARELLEAGGISWVYCCGPLPFMRAVAQIAAAADVACWVSMEKRMACGVGACLSCVVDTTSGRKRSCVDGPIFDAKEVVWQ